LPAHGGARAHRRAERARSAARQAPLGRALTFAMLADLRIRSLAVIEDLEIAFEPGFNVITGETGAGKTMLMRAIGLVLGARGGSELVREGEREAEIEALFAGPGILPALGGDDDDEPTEVR